MQRLEDIDRELSGFGKSDEVLREVIARGVALGRTLGALDLATLRALGGDPLRDLGDAPSADAEPAPRPVESLVPAGAAARAISWDEARPSTTNAAAEVGSGMLDLAELRAAEVPPVLSPSATEGAPDEEAGALALEPDPELGELRPEVPVVRPPTQPPPRPVSVRPPSAEALLAEMLDQPEEEIAVRWTPEPAVPSVAEDEARDALAELLAEDAQELAQEGELAAERTVMVSPGALRSSDVVLDDLSDFEIDVEDEALAPAVPVEAKKSRPPPPPPSRQPEAPAQSFLSRILKGNKG